MFNFLQDTSIVSSLFFLFVSQDDFLCWLGHIWFSIEMCHSNIKKCNLTLPVALALALTSSLELSPMFVDINSNSAPVTGSNLRLIATSLHTSDSREASKFLTASWRAWIKPPFLQSIAWVVLNCFPPGQWLIFAIYCNGIYLSYLMARASPNSSLFKTHYSSSKGSTFSQSDTPLLRVNEMVLSFSRGRHYVNSSLMLLC